MNRIETHKMYDRWPILPDLDRVRPWLDDDQRKALDDVVEIYAVERERAGSLMAIVGANTSELDPSDQWHGPNATAARAEDERRAETAIRNGKPVPDPTAVPALRATVARLAAQRRPVVTVANDLLAVLEQTLTAGRDALIAGAMPPSTRRSGRGSTSTICSPSPTCSAGPSTCPTASTSDPRRAASAKRCAAPGPRSPAHPAKRSPASANG